MSENTISEPKGYLVLEGGAEFGGKMADADRRSLELAGGLEAKVAILPTAAAPDHNHERAGRNGERWFRSLGAKNVQVVGVIDRATANDPQITATLRAARLVYLLGGFTHYLGQTLIGSTAWEAVLEAYRSGAVVAGSSAGAMVMCSHYYDPGQGGVHSGLGLVDQACVLPHFNSFGKGWVGKLSALLPEVTLLGIDERTGMVNDREAGGWQVYGGGNVTVLRGGRKTVYRPGDSFQL